MTRAVEAIEAEIADLTGRLEAAKAEAIAITKAKAHAIPESADLMLTMLAEAIRKSATDKYRWGSSEPRILGDYEVRVTANPRDDGVKNQ